MSQLIENEVAEFKGQLIDSLEDYLEECGVTPSMLPNEERDDEDDAIIYGSHYDMVGNAIQHELDIYNLVGRENPVSNPQIIAMAINHIYEGYEELVGMIEPEFVLESDDERRLKQEIRQTFVNWEVFA